MRKIFSIVLFFIFLSSIVWADSVPHVFISGEPAKAIQVNENFQFLADKIPVITGIKSVNTGIGLTGGAVSGDINLEIDTSTVQTRISGECQPGEYIKKINVDGTVVCEIDQVEPAAVEIPGNWTSSGSDDIYYNQGNVGIGNSSPLTILDIEDETPMLAIRATGDILSTDVATIELHTIEDNGIDTTRAAIVAGSSGNSNREGYLSLKTRPSTGGTVERMKITSSGDVGIGVDPASKLDVNGNIKSSSISGPWDNSGDGYIRLGNVQIMWGINGSTETDITFNPPFFVVPAITLTSVESFTLNNIDLGVVTTSSAHVKWVEKNGLYYTSGYHWIAIGTWQ